MGAGHISFGPFILDRGSETLLSAGKPVAVGRRGFALLAALAEAEGAVSKQALMDAAWPGTIVEEGNLTVQMAALRKALGTRPDGQEWIVTVPRLGYRLLRAEAVTAPTHPVLPTLAVLPFVNLSGDVEQDYFADGMVEDITTALSRFKSFAVVSRSSTLTFRNRPVDIRDAARDLGVRYVLEGSVRRSGERLRISTKLTDGETGVQLWAQTFDGTIRDVFDMQDKVTDNVVAIVEPQIKRAELDRSRRKRPESLDAYDLYLQALPDVFAMRPEANSRAIGLLERAVLIDEGYAPALTMLGVAYLARTTMQLASVDAGDTDRAVAYARAALQTGTDDPLLLGYAGFILVQLGLQYDEGFALLRRAAAENPNSVATLTNIAIACLLGGDLDEALLHFERALALNPSELGTHWQLTGIAHVRMAQGRYEEALEAARKSLGTNAGYDATYWMLIAGNAFLGRMEEARHFADRLRSISPHATLARIRRGQHSRDPHRIDVLIEGMRLAGLPDDGL